ncbi:hypothetical protein EV361DRAFT_954500 [Lentinula raphanica]|nr:hypothetical protein EV360DRAFT_76524 [Lentinula raphanica]KAJ3816868.1 hypothetical protein F5880DRAFT_1618836 [Lentinula raphanica]KAJ3965982.1 hypothetical protein EV361DRAFT_954500 [Lentinula raphanica]
MSSRTIAPIFLDQMEMRLGVPIVDRTLLLASPLPSSTKTVHFQSSIIDSQFSATSTTPRMIMESINRPATPMAHGTEDYESPDEDTVGIPKPEGEVGRPGRGGYNLRTTLNWPYKRWKLVHGFIRNRVLATLDCSLPFSDQPLLKLQAIRDEALTKFTFLSDYEKLWVVDDLVRCRLKYEKSALKRKADAKLAEEARAKAKKHLTITIPPSKRHSD